MDIKITFVSLMKEWFKTAVDGYWLKRVDIGVPLPLDELVHILCRCHQMYEGYGNGRALGIISDEHVFAITFPNNENSDLIVDRSTWTYLYPADPEFFTKLIMSLDEVHIKRYGTEVVRSSPRLGRDEQMAHQGNSVETVH
jgi:hypothetical protein